MADLSSGGSCGREMKGYGGRVFDLNGPRKDGKVSAGGFEGKNVRRTRLCSGKL